MVATKPRRILSVALILLVATAARGQDFRVGTEIRDVSSQSAGKGKERGTIGRSMALFHAGKVYDGLDNSAQLTIFEPAQERFVIIDRSRRVATTVEFSDIEAILAENAQRGEQKLVGLHGSADRNDRKAAELLRFQLHPRFKESYDPAKKQLTLSSELLSYAVQCVPASSPEIVRTYLHFADWAARLNYVVNPRASYPEPRLALNQALHGQNMLPSEVELCWRQGGGLHLKARHKFTWKLDPNDRELIHDWEKLLRAPDIKQVALPKFLELTQSPGNTARR